MPQGQSYEDYWEEQRPSVERILDVARQHELHKDEKPPPQEPRTCGLCWDSRRS